MKNRDLFKITDRSLQLFAEAALWLLMLLGIAAGIYNNSRGLDEELVMDSFTDQHIYQERFTESGMLPDSYLRELIRYRRVYVPYEVKDYSAYSETEEADRESEFSQAYYKENNLTRYFQEYAGECVSDGKLPGYERVTELKEADPEAFEEGFRDLGLINDMLRYSFICNKEGIRESAYFWYSWYYYSFAEHKSWYAHLYLQEGAEEAEDIVAIWDKRENLYIYSLQGYEESWGDKL